jgi:hypothetical protein
MLGSSLVWAKKCMVRVKECKASWVCNLPFADPTTHVPKLLSCCCCSLLTTLSHLLFGLPFAHSSPYPPPVAILILVSDFWFLGLAFCLASCSLPLIPVLNVWEHEDGWARNKKKSPTKKNQQWEPIHQKYETNENTRRHNSKKKQKQTINKN